MSTKEKRKLKRKDNLVKIWSPIILEEVYNKFIIKANREEKEGNAKKANSLVRRANMAKDRMQRILNLIEKGLQKEGEL